MGVRPTRAVHSFSQGSHRVSQILSCGTYEGQCTVGPHLGQLAGSSAASRHSTRAAARHDHSTSQSVSQLFHGPAPRSDPSPTSDHSLLLNGRLRCRPLSAVLTASCAQGSRPRGFLSGTQFWWNWSAPLVRRWYAACAGNRALAVTRLDDHFFQGLLWARRLNLGRGPSSPAPSPDTSPGRTKSFSDFRWT